jgi:hypothetical protein
VIAITIHESGSGATSLSVPGLVEAGATATTMACRATRYVAESSPEQIGARCFPKETPPKRDFLHSRIELRLGSEHDADAGDPSLHVAVGIEPLDLAALTESPDGTRSLHRRVLTVRSGEAVLSARTALSAPGALL